MDHRITERVLCASIVAATLYIPIENLHAEETGAGIEEVVVTATRRSESMQEVPIALSVFDEDDMDRQGLQTLQDLQYEVPNMTMYVVSSFASWINMRGVPSNPNGVFNSGTSPGLGVYVDGVVFSRQTGFNQELSNIERVEVLRGPQGTLFGQNTNLGVISYTTRKPGDSLEGKIKLEAGKFDSRKVNAYVAGPLIDGVLSAGFSGFYVEGDGADKSGYDGNPAYAEDRSGGRLQFHVTPRDNLTIDIAANMLRDRGAGITRGDITELVPGAFASGALFFSQNPFGTAPGGGVEPFTEDQIIIDGKHTVSTRTDFNQATRDEFGLDATVEYELDNGVMLKSITAYKDYESELQYDLGGTAMQMFPNLQAEGNKQFTQEFQILSSAEDRTRYVAGVFYLDNESENEQYVAFGEHMYFIPVPTGAETRLNADLSTRSMAIFGNVTHDLTDTTSIFAGLRYSDIEKEIKVSQSDSVFIFGLINLPNHKQKLSDDFVSWTVGVNHRIETEAFEINLYAKSSQGYKEGGFTTRLLSLSEIGGDINNPNMGFDREEVLEYEVGMKGMFFEDRLRLNLAYYDLDYKDIQTTRLDDNDFSRITNGPSATSKGFELDSTYIISQYFRLVTSVGRSEAKYGTFTNCSPTRDCSGNYLPFSSEWTVSTSLDFQYPLEIFNWTLFGGLDYNYRSPRYTNPGNVFPPSANRFFNAQIGLRSEETGLQLLLMGKNLRDEDNILSETRDNTFGHVSTRYGVPRSWTAQLTYSF